MQTMLIMCFVTAVAAFAALRWLQSRWEIPSLTGVPGEALSRWLPRPALSLAHLRRQLAAKIVQERIIMPSGTTVGASHIVVRLSELDADNADAHFGGLDTVAADLASLYQRHALREGWTLSGGVRVQVLVAPELRPGWIRVEPSQICDADGDSARATRRHPVSAHGHGRPPSATTTQIDHKGNGTVQETPASVPSLQLVGGGIDRTIIEPPATLGRGPESTVVLTNPLVSSSHAVIELAASGWTIKDAGSTNGIYVNGSRVESQTRQLLREGDRVRLARTGPELRVAVIGRTTWGG